MSKHTPGPWEIGSNMILKVINGSYFSIAEVNDWEDETVSNARLIAAAPDLLAVLEELQESATYWSEYDVPIGIVDRINAAIAKAKGEA